MYRLADAYQQDVESLHFTDLNQVFSYVAAIPYVPDAVDCRAAECLKRPAITIERGGDCDDKAILAGACCNLLRVPWRIVTASYADPDTHTHVYIQVHVGDRWLPFDATYPNNRIFAEQPFVTRKIWPMTTKTLYGVTTLEGLGDGAPIPNADQWTALLTTAGKQVVGSTFDLKTISKSSLVTSAAAIAQAAVPIPVVGAMIGAAVGYLLSLIGIRKGTEHMPVADAERVSQNIAQSVVNIYRQLPADGRTFLAGQCAKFLADMESKFGSWWGGMDLAAGDDPSVGYLARIMKNQRAHPEWWDTEEKRVYNSIWIPCYVVLRAADLTTAKDNFESWVVKGSLTPIVMTPLGDFISTRLNQLVQYNQDGTVTLVNKPGSTSGAAVLPDIAKNPLFWVVAGGAAYIALSLFKKKR
jgi:hypothetical protein